MYANDPNKQPIYTMSILLFYFLGYVAPPPAAESGVDPMYANDPNVIVVDTNSLPTR